MEDLMKTKHRDGRDSSKMNAQADPGDTGAKQTDRLIQDFLSGWSDAVGILVGWARSVAEHNAWGFQAPEDVVQATLLALVKNLRDKRFKGGDLRAYVCRITKNMCITNYRRQTARGRHVSLEESAYKSASTMSGEVVERRALLARIMERLNEKCRQIILLAYIQGYSRKEIGSRFGISEKAARIKLFRCIEQARTMMEDLGNM
jgi:RNA polymerase sigma-70 factor (ECF subfamily)